MSMVPTVRIVSGDSYAIINETEFDSERHVLYSEPAPEIAPDRNPGPDLKADASGQKSGAPATGSKGK